MNDPYHSVPTDTQVFLISGGLQGQQIRSYQQGVVFKLYIHILHEEQVGKHHPKTVYFQEQLLLY